MFKAVTSAMKGIPIFPVAVLTVFVICGIFGGFFMPHNPLEARLMDSLMPPFWQEAGSTTYLLGTDSLGRDILSRIIGGASISLQIGFVVVSIAAGVGCLLALLSGFLGGWVDIIIMRVTDMMLSLPYLLIAIVLAAALGASQGNVILVLVIIGWAQYARVLRGEVLRIKEADFIRLAVVAGASKTRIMLRHISPNMVNTLIILATLQLGVVIITEASLSFIGVGIPPPTPSWGAIIADGRNHIMHAWWLSTFAGIAIFLTVLSFNLLGDWLRVRLDPKFRQL